MSLFGNRNTEVAKPTMIGGAAGHMLKGMGIDPVHVEQVAESLIAEISGAHNRLAAIEARMDDLEATVRAQDAKLDAILAALTAPSSSGA